MVIKNVFYSSSYSIMRNTWCN